MYKFKVGDRVMLCPTSQWSINPSEVNPLDVEGVVSKIFPRGTLPLEVFWKEGWTNTYSDEDLILIQDAKNQTDEDRINLLEDLCSTYATIIEEQKQEIKGLYNFIKISQRSRL